MRKMRKLHLWIGLLTSVLLLVEAVTGLIMMEPWLIGGEAHGHGGEGGRRPEGELPPGVGGASVVSTAFSLQRFIRNLHAGRIGNIDITWLTDLAAVSIIVLTVTGIYLSIRILRAEKKKKRVEQESKGSVA